MKPIPPHALLEIPSRDWQQLRHGRHVAMKHRVEARHLRDVGKLFRHRLDQCDLARQMIGIDRGDVSQLFDHLRRDRHMVQIFLPAMHNAMPDGSNIARLRDGLQPFRNCRNRPLPILGRLKAIQALNRTRSYAVKRIAPLKKRELYARGTAVDREYVSRHKASCKCKTLSYRFLWIAVKHFRQ
jgi:hypothetical protein